MKKSLIKGTIILFLSLLFSFLCYTAYHMYLPRQVHYYLTASTSLEKEKLGDISLLQSIKTLSPPPNPNKDNVLFDYYTYGKDTIIATERDDDKIIRIQQVKDSVKSGKTAKGIHIGRTKKEVISAYGTSFYTREELGLSIIGYIDKANHRTLEFWLSENNVDMIRYDMASMN